LSTLDVGDFFSGIVAVPGRMPPLVTACLAASRAVLSLTGPEARTFLQGYITSNVLKCAATGTYGVMLNAQGRVLADVFVYPTTVDPAAPVLLDCDRSLAPSLLKHLTLFKLRTKVTIADEKEAYRVWTTWRPNSAAAPTSVTDGGSGIAAPHSLEDSRCPIPAVRALLPSAARPADAPEVPPEEWLVHRITWGVPEGAHDFRHGKSFPFECNLDYSRGVHFDKGCYLGQEPTARTYFRGATKKRLVPIQFYPDPPSPDSTATAVSYDPTTAALTPPTGASLLDADGQNVGTVGSRIHNIGLAMVRLPPPPVLTVEVPSGQPPLYARAFPPAWWADRGTGK